MVVLFGYYNNYRRCCLVVTIEGCVPRIFRSFFVAENVVYDPRLRSLWKLGRETGNVTRFD